jgi:hypothetical protein
MQHPEASPIRFASVLLIVLQRVGRGMVRARTILLVLLSTSGFSELLSPQDSVAFLQHQQLIGINVLEGLNQP